jgi:hypothetical protein
MDGGIGPDSWSQFANQPTSSSPKISIVNKVRSIGRNKSTQRLVLELTFHGMWIHVILMVSQALISPLAIFINSELLKIKLWKKPRFLGA